MRATSSIPIRNNPVPSGPSFAGTERCLTFAARERETLRDFVSRIQSHLSHLHVDVLSQEVFLSDPDDFDAESPPEAGWPVAWLLEDHPPVRRRIQSRVTLLSGQPPEYLSIGGQVCGSLYEDAYCRCLRLSGMTPLRAEDSRGDQTKCVFDRMEAALHEAEMDFRHVVRTWFYNQQILAWYPEFNQVRNDFFRRRQVFQDRMPASTGIGAPNPFGLALSAGLLAIQHKTDRTSDHPIPSPLQNAAVAYGSSFSRAVEILTPQLKRLLISGTASIDAAGKSVHVGDLEGQIDWTLEVVEGILRSRAMDWRDVTGAHAYLIDPAGEEVFLRGLKRKKIPEFPMLITGQTICREDLLFEIELEASRTAA